MTACASGCVHRGTHKPGCSCGTPHDEQHEGHCAGCEPRETVEGQLCGRCWGGLQRDVRTAPALVRWIREQVEPSMQQHLAAETTPRIRGPRVDSSAPFYMPLAKRSPASESAEPITVAAVDDADALHAMLASWALLILEEHPANLVATRPRAQRRSAEGDVVGILPESDATESIARFIDTHLAWCAAQPWADELVRETSSTTRTLLARYPQAERSRHLADAKCRVCGRTSMVYHPPEWAGQDILVQCEHADCGAIVPEHEWGLYMRMIAEDRKREKAS